MTLNYLHVLHLCKNPHCAVFWSFGFRFYIVIALVEKCLLHDTQYCTWDGPSKPCDYINIMVFESVQDFSSNTFASTEYRFTNKGEGC